MHFSHTHCMCKLRIFKGVVHIVKSKDLCHHIYRVSRATESTVFPDPLTQTLQNERLILCVSIIHLVHSANLNGYFVSGLC